MSYNGSGTFLINSAGQPVVANTVISATVFNALTSDLATGLSTAITKDGQTTITNNIPFGSNKITGLGSGTAAADAANLGQVQSTVAKLITVTGTDTITGSMSPQLTAYAAGQLFYFVANAANTSAVTLNIDSLGAKNITRDGSSALAAGDINSGEVVVVIYDGTRFQMINAANSFGNTTINGTLTVTGNAGFQANVSITSALSVGGVFAVTGAATFTANPTLSAGTANGVLYLNGSKVATSGSALTWNGTSFGVSGNVTQSGGNFFTDTTSGYFFAGAGAFTGGIYGSSAGSLANIIAPTSIVGIIGSTEQMRLTSTGLGIGTASPGAKLDVAGVAQAYKSGKGTINALDTASYAAGVGGTIDLGGNYRATGDYQAFVRIAAEKANATNNDYGYNMGFYVTTNGGSTLGTKALTIDSSGNAGLGVTTDLNLGVSDCRGLSIGGTTTYAGIQIRNSTGNLEFFVGGDSAVDALIRNNMNGPLRFGTNGTERARITAAGELLVGVTSATANGGVIQVSNGITFPATQSASSNANTLDDYEEGTWTGTFSPSTSGTITINTSDDTGAYTKIGRQVTVTGNFSVTSVSSPVGVLVTISGLPFAIGDGTETSQRGSGSVMYYDVSATTAYVRPIDYIETQSSFRVWLDASTVEANDSFTFTVTYFV